MDIALRGMPTIVLRAIGLFVPIVREVGEMLHQWEAPFEVDDAQFHAAFGVSATGPDEGAVRTVEWARAQFGPSLNPIVRSRPGPWRLGHRGWTRQTRARSPC